MSGRTRALAALAPAIGIHSLRAAAASGRPKIGASTYALPCLACSAASCLALAGETVARDDLFDRGAVPQDRHDDAAARDDVDRSRRQLGAARDERVGLARRSIVYDQRMAGAHEVGGHR
jgi:hypothetical protein